MRVFLMSFLVVGILLLLDINNTIFQWGTTTNSTTVTFPISFTQKPKSMATMGEYNNSFNGCGYMSLKTGTLTKTGCEWIQKVANFTTYYIVVGY